MQIQLTPIATVRNTRTETGDDFWGSTISEIELSEVLPEEAFEGIEAFSHLEVIYHFNQAAGGKIKYARRPRGNDAWPMMGIFAQRNKDRPNGIGLTTVELLEHRGRTIVVRWLDAIDGTPVLDIKPVFREFRPAADTRQPAWVEELMRDYWK